MRLARSASLLPALAALMLLPGCHKASTPAKNLDQMDAALVDSAGNRQLASAIKVDPHRGMPVVAEGASNCLSGLVYANDWAAKLPADLPMHPQARLQEAAGHDGVCKARVASFAVTGDRAAVLDWYRTKAQAGGYETEREDKNGDWVLAGTRKDVIFVITIGTPARGATPVDYVWTEGA